MNGGTNLGKTPILQPFVFTKYFCVRPLGGVLLKALPQEISKEGRDCFWDGRFGGFHDAEHYCVHMTYQHPYDI